MGLEKPPLRIPLDSVGVRERSRTRINPSGKTPVGMMLPGHTSHPKPHLLKQLGEIPGCFQGEERGNFHFLGIQGNIPAPLPPGSTQLLQTCPGETTPGIEHVPHRSLLSLGKALSIHGLGSTFLAREWAPGLPALVFQGFLGKWKAPGTPQSPIPSLDRLRQEKHGAGSGLPQPARGWDWVEIPLEEARAGFRGRFSNGFPHIFPSWHPGKPGKRSLWDEIP